MTTTATTTEPKSERVPKRGKPKYRMPVPSAYKGSVLAADPVAPGSPAARPGHRPAPVLSTGQVAYLLGAAPRTVANWADTGRLKCYRLPPGTISSAANKAATGDRRIPVSCMIEFCRENGIPIPAGFGVVAVVGYQGGPPIRIPDRETVAVDGWVELAMTLNGRPVVAWVIDYAAGRGEGDRAGRLIRAIDPGVPVARLLPEDVEPAELAGLTRDFRRPFDPEGLEDWLAVRLVRKDGQATTA